MNKLFFDGINSLIKEFVEKKKLHFTLRKKLTVRANKDCTKYLVVRFRGMYLSRIGVLNNSKI
jgi:hypothetical protein